MPYLKIAEHMSSAKRIGRTQRCEPQDARHGPGRRGGSFEIAGNGSIARIGVVKVRDEPVFRHKNKFCNSRIPGPPHHENCTGM